MSNLGSRFMAVFALTFTMMSFVGAPARAELTGALRKAEIARKVDVLAKMAFGLRVHSVEGANGDEMVLNLAMEGSGYASAEEYIREEGFVRDLQSKDIQFGDMISWGTMKISAAQDLFAADDDWENGRGRAARRRGLGQTILKELSEMKGVSFGFTDGSSSYCGISFMGLLIVDEENGIIYELSLTNSGPC